eukprot:Phypoly_transcript_09848.p1 GENE.Phypoly_transcript_09848~~Phypoly_transcript_09848.p1  ORF type:complete len:325 (+),score=31.00 Phypoly_transcript_09848:94-1068(+)
MKKLVLLPVLLFIILALNLYAPSIKKPLSIIGTQSPIVLAHRGSRVLAPENTLLAFQNALDFGADVIEMDVQLTKDKALVIFHDDRVDRVTNSSGRVADFTVAELQQLDVGYKFTHNNGTSFPFRGKGLHIPTPEEVFETFPDAYFNIEIKNPDLLAADLLYSAITNKNMQHHVVIGGRWCPCIRHFRQISANQKIRTSACEGEVIPFLLHAFLHTSHVWYSFFYPLQAQLLQIPTASGPYRLDTVAVFSALKHLGQHVHYWVINDPKEMARLLELGADGIITDRPDILFTTNKRGMWFGKYWVAFCFIHGENTLPPSKLSTNT